ncbi:MAG: hypothetical protein ACRC8S_08075 [Fimbriiglobus sp.]
MASLKDMILQKGDKIAIGIGAASMGLLSLWGLVTLAGAESPTKITKEFEQKASSLKSQVAAEGQDAPELPGWVMKGADKVKIDPQQFAIVGSPFEPVNYPDLKRKNPIILGIDQAHLNVVRFPMISWDIQDSPDGKTVLLGVVTNAPKSSATPEEIKKNLEGLKQQGKAAQKSSPRVNRPPANPSGQGGGMIGGPPGMGVGGGGPPGPGGPPGMGAGGPPGMGGGARGGGEGGMEGGMGIGGMGGYTGGARDDKTVEYLTLDQVEKSGKPLAKTVYPLRSVVVTATFPIRKQLEMFKEALRVPTIQQAKDLSKGGPIFDGFEVDRMVKPPNGTWSEWAPYEHSNRYAKEIRRRMTGTMNEYSGYLGYFMTPPEQKMVAPLPILADGLGDYPKVYLPAVVTAAAKLKELQTPPPSQSETERRFGGGAGTENPYAPVGGAPAGAGAGFAGGGFTGEGIGSMPGGFGGGGMRGGPGGMTGGPPSGAFPGGPPPGAFPGGPSGGPPAGVTGGITGMPPGTGTGALSNQQVNPLDDIIQHTLLRFLDVDVLPGYSYQYRVRVIVKNPNFGATNEVSQPELAKQELLYGPWVQLPETITIPSDQYLFAHDTTDYVTYTTKLYEEYGKEPAIRKFFEYEDVAAGKRTVVQIHQWMPAIRIEGAGSKTEPVGSWVVAEIPVGPGEYIRKRQLIELPLWSGGLGNYVLRELGGGVKVASVKNPKHQPRGWPINFRTSMILVDFDGGNKKARVNDKDIVDNSDSELLILGADGKLSIRNSGTDLAEKNRTERDSIWLDWINRVKARKDMSAPAGGPPGTGGGFERN